MLGSWTLGCGGDGGSGEDAGVLVPDGATDDGAVVDGAQDDDGSAIDAGGDGGLSADAQLGGARLEFDSATHDFGSVVSGTTSAPFIFTVTNTGTAPTGTISLGMSGANASEFLSAGNGCANLAPNATCTVTVVFTPTAEGSRAAVLSATPLNGAAGSVIIFGTGAPRVPKLEITPTAQAFGSVVTGRLSGTFTFRVANVGVAPTGPTSITITGADAADFVNDIPTSGDCTANIVLNPTQSCNVRLRFGGQTVGAKVATLQATASPGGTATAALTGTAVVDGPAVLELSPAGSQDFGTGTPGLAGNPVTFTITNSGQTSSGSIAVTIAGPGAARFVKSNDLCSNASLDQGQSCVFQVAFSPSEAGAQSATLTVVANPGGLITSSLNGTATASLTATVNGMGTVTSSPTGVSCPGTCTATFNQTPVTLTATPSAGWGLSAWGGACSGQNQTCDVVMNSARTVSATFLQLRRLTVASVGMGQITSSVGAISCPGSCSASLLDGTPVTLSAAPAPGYRFDSWSEASCATTGTVCMVTADADRTVTATFKPLETLTVTVATLGVGAGSVTITPQGQAQTTCAVGTCTRIIDQGSSVTLSVTNSADTRFNGWTGDCATFGTATTCTILMDRPRTAGVAFESYNLQLSIAGPAGAGSVGYSSVTCLPNCARNYLPGSVVTLTPASTTGYIFAGWTGDCSGNSVCMATMNRNKLATATFAVRRRLTFTKTGSGGTVTSPDSQINCGSTCSSDFGDYPEDATVVLSVALAAGAGIVWTGCDSSTDTTCTVTLTGDMAVSGTLSTAADLVVTALTCPDAASPGQTLSCTVTVQNNSAAPAGASTTDLLLSVDGNVTTSDLTIGSCAFPAFAANETQTLTCTGTVPAAQALGQYTVGAEADARQVVTETLNGNNIGGAEALVVFQSGAADLVATSLSCTPSPVNQGASATCALAVANLGGTDAATSTASLRLSADTTIDGSDQELTTCSVAALAAGASTSLACVGTVPGSALGAGYLGVILDQGMTVTESNEANNTRSVTTFVTIPGAVDLTITAWACSPATATPGAVNLSCSATVRNLGGTMSADVSLDVRLSADTSIDGTDTLLRSCTIPALAPGGSTTVSCSGSSTIPAGRWQLAAVADGTAIIAEASEANNIALDTLDAGADLVVASVVCASSGVVPGGSLSCTTSITNSGVTTTGVGSSYQLYLSTDAIWDAGDLGLGGGTISIVAAGATASSARSISISAGTPIGSYFVIARADTLAEIAEMNEANNEGSVALQVGLPDISVVSLVCSDPVLAGTSMNCTVTFRNQGVAPTGTFSYKMYRSTDAAITLADTPFASTCSAATIAPGAMGAALTCTGTLPIDTTAGPWFVGVIADHGGAVAESNENNNSASVPITATTVDFAVTGFDCAASALQNGSLSCTVTVGNLGSTGAPASNGRLRLSTDSTVNTSDTDLGICVLPAIAAGGSASATCTVTIPAAAVRGREYVGYFANDLTPVSEYNTANNLLTDTIMVIQPGVVDLHVQSVSCPSIVTAGALMTCTATLWNLGDQAAPAFTLRLRSGTAGTGSSYIVMDCPIAGQAGGTVASVPCGGMATWGYQSMSMLADAADVIVEASESNNQASTNVAVVEPGVVELRISRVSCSPSRVPLGTQSVSCDVYVRNHGELAAGASTLELRYSTNQTFDPATDPLISSCATPAVPSGQEVRVACGGSFTTATAGNPYLVAKADVGLVVAELFENNNTGSTNILVGPDLQVGSVTCTPNPVAVGGTLTCSMTFYAVSGGDPVPAFSWRLYASTDSTITTADTPIGASCAAPAIAAGGNTGVQTCTGVVPALSAGAHYFGAYGDPDGLVAESQETNNGVSTSVTVQ
ncbi:MAG: choice-of-anchor D domain-containing protein [Deltaproteobacteria bacterium]|nr:choice-of-anchor D domain-containing protein [Deltaproteobacteria bacterium]